MSEDLNIHKYKNAAGYVVEAAYFDGYNGTEIAEWCGGRYYVSGPSANDVVHYVAMPTFLSGKIYAFPGDYIIKSAIGEFYAYSPEVMIHMFELIVEAKENVK